MQLRAMIFGFLLMLSSNNDTSIYFILFFGRGRCLTFRYPHLNRQKIRHMRSVCLILHLFEIYVEKRNKHSNGLI